MKLFFCIIGIFIMLTNCTKNTQTIKSEIENKSFLTGIWTDHSSENATFVIEKDSIYYVDSNKRFSYSTKNDSLLIKYEGFEGAYKVIKLNADSLILADNEAKTIFVRFKD